MFRRTVRVLLASVLLAVSSRVSAQSPVTASYTITNATAVGFGNSLISPVSTYATRAICKLETGDIRYTLDGTTVPTATVGTRWTAAEALTLTNPTYLRQFSAIAISTTGTLYCTFYFDRVTGAEPAIVGVSSAPGSGGGGGGGGAVTIADGADSTLGTTTNAKSTATDTTSVTGISLLKEISFMEQNPASRAVTNAGTFAVQAAQSGTWTVQPGNTANTTPWLMSISQGGNTAQVNASSQLSVVCANCSGSGVSQVDNTGFTYGTTVFVPTGGVYNSTITNLTSGDAGAAALTQKRKLHVALFDSTDTAITQTAGALDINIKSGSLPAGTNVIGHVIADSGSTTAVTQATAANLNATVVGTGTFATQATLQTQTDTVMVGGVNVKEWSGTAPAAPDANSYVLTAPAATATTTAGASTCYLTSAATTNSTNCKNAAGNVYAIRAINTTTTNYFLRLYNLSTAPTCSSATGFVETIPILGAAANGGGISAPNGGVGQAYSTGIGFCLTGGGSSTDNTSAATGVYLTILYK